MNTKKHSPRDPAAMRRRRTHAARLFAGGKLTQAEIARKLGVSRQSVMRWHDDWLDGGTEALRGADRLGRRPRLTEAQQQELNRVLLLGARAHGFGTDLWTLPRIAKVIKQVTGVVYHPGHVWRIVRSLGWSLQRPAKQARERNQAAVDDWVTKRWAKVKKTPNGTVPGSSSPTKAGSRSSR
jgi:transposase